MNNLSIEYSSHRCIGAKRCIEVFPKFFSFDGERAVLNGAVKISEINVLQIKASEEQTRLFIKAAEQCPVNAIKVTDTSKNKILVSTDIIQDSVRSLYAEYDDSKEFIMDPHGYFLIRIDHQHQEIEVGLCTELNKVSVKVVGKNPLEIYQTIIKHGLISRLDHAAYLGRELQKAYIALQKRIPYVQDDELSF